MSTLDSAEARIPSETAKQLLPWLVAVAFFMESLDTTILNTAVPAIAEALHVAPLSMKSVLASYTLSLAVFIPISGWMADRYGTRLVFSSAIGLFTLGSLLCGLSSSIHILVAFRILQGCGGAMMVPVGRLALARTFPKSELIRAMSFVSIPGLIGPMLGPIAGGLIVAYFHWRVIFFVNLPIGILGLILVHLHLPDFREERTPPLDWLGLILFASGIALLSYVLEVFGEHTLSTLEITAYTIISLVLLALYGWHGSRARFPLLSLGLFRVRTFRSSVNGSFFTRIGIGGIPFLFPLLYQVGLGYTPTESGLLMMPQALAAMSLKVAMGKLLARYGFRRVLIANTILLGAIIFVFATFGIASPIWYIVAISFVYGFLSSLQYTSMNTLVFADIYEEQTSNASTISSTVRQLSMSFGVAGASLVTAIFIPGGAGSKPPELIHGIHNAFLVLGAATILSTITFAELKVDDGLAVSRGSAHGKSGITATEAAHPAE